MVECEFINHSDKLIHKSCFNRYMVECEWLNSSMIKDTAFKF